MRRSLPRDRGRLVAGASSGVVAGAAFAGVMAVDMAASRRKVNDFRMLADFGPLRRFWPLTGPAIHFVNSAGLGAVYSVAEPALRGPGWARGLTFALAENTVLWPIVMLIDRAHPAIRAGELERFHGRWPFMAETLRHAAYGLVLGYFFERRTRSS